MAFTVHKIPVSQTRPLRAAILRPGQSLERSIYPADADPNSFHAGAFQGEQLVGVASIYYEPPPWGPDPSSWRLRGMAVAHPVRGQGVGRALVLACLDRITSQNGTLIWCNARSKVLPFYHSLDFQTRGLEFDVPESGPHFVMWREVTSNDRSIP